MYIAIATSQDLPELFGGEKLLPAALKELGCRSQIRIWDDPSVEWQNYDAVLIRCPWDYHEKLPQFLGWLAKLAEQNIRLINDLETLRWNLDKKYLFELAQKGLPVIPSLCVTPSDMRSLANLFAEIGSEEIVIKPVQSAGAWRTLRVNHANIDVAARDFNEWRQEQEFLVQAFMPEIVSDGEWSMMYFNGRYSHTVVKRAKAGDFRVQSDHGGTVQSAEAAPAMRAQAAKILTALPTMPCYARVDGVVRGSDFFLMELELLEPELFLEFDVNAPANLAGAIVQCLAVK
jgi:glutathione synthase/RimK-type ligase-like ATP-grasp enzyme